MRNILILLSKLKTNKFYNIKPLKNSFVNFFNGFIIILTNYWVLLRE